MRTAIPVFPGIRKHVREWKHYAQHSSRAKRLFGLQGHRSVAWTTDTAYARFMHRPRLPAENGHFRSNHSAVCIWCALSVVCLAVLCCCCCKHCLHERFISKISSSESLVDSWPETTDCPASCNTAYKAAWYCLILLTEEQLPFKRAIVTVWPRFSPGMTAF